MKILLIFVFFLTTTALHARTFTNAQGVKIEAEIVSISGEQVTMKTGRGQNVTFAISLLSAEDQAFVKAWKPAGAENTLVEGGVYLAVGPGGHRMISTDAKTWEKHQEWSPPAHNNDDLNVAIFYKGMGIVGGGFSMARVVASRDGETWSDGKLPGGSPIFGFDVLDDVLYATCISGQVYATMDGEDWKLVGKNEQKVNGQGVRWTASGNGLILGVGDFGSVLVISESGTKVENFTIAGQEKKMPTASLLATAFLSSADRKASSPARRTARNGRMWSRRKARAISPAWPSMAKSSSPPVPKVSWPPPTA